MSRTPLAFVSPPLPRPPRRSSRNRKLTTVASIPPTPPPEKSLTWHQTQAKDRCLRLSLALSCGQAFRWNDHGTHSFPPCYRGIAREYAGAIGNHLYVLRQAEEEPPCNVDDPVWFRVLTEEEGAVDVLNDYFRVHVDLSPVFVKCCHNDVRFHHVFPFFRGVRVVRQPPVECLFAFICSANNNLKRIAGMVKFMAKRYGKRIGEYRDVVHYEFPQVEALANATEEELRDAGFGYRAKYIVGAANELLRLAKLENMSVEEMLLSWRHLEREELANKLVVLPGVGRKVASCIGLFSLDQFGEVPCDTHIWQIATRYMPELEQKSLTEKVYAKVGGFFRERFGEDTAGLAQTILFCAELAEFQDLVPEGERIVKKKRKPRSKKPKDPEESEEEVVIKHKRRRQMNSESRNG